MIATPTEVLRSLLNDRITIPGIPHPHALHVMSRREVVNVIFPILTDITVHNATTNRLPTAVDSPIVALGTPPLPYGKLPRVTHQTGITIVLDGLVTTPLTMFLHLFPTNSLTNLRSIKFLEHPHPNPTLTLIVGQGIPPLKIVICTLTRRL